MTEEQPEPTRVRTREDLSRELTALRSRSGLTVRDLAGRLDAPVATVGDYFSGRHLPGTRQLPLYRAVLAACGVTDPDRIEAWVAALMRARSSSDGRTAKSAAPYRGLEPFREDDAALFLGRTSTVAELVAGLCELRDGGGPGRGTGMVALVGPSGSGKSSVLLAGLIPAIRGGALNTTLAKWSATVCTVDQLRRQESQAQGGEGPTVVVIDQFEEALNLPTDERTRVMQCVTGLAGSSLLVVALRADFYQAAAAEPVLLEALRDHQILLGPMTPDELREAILEPARRVGASVEEGLVDLVLADLSPRGRPQFAYDPGALPLLSYALLVAWERAGRNQLTIADYRAVGGLRGAVLQAAERQFAGLDPAEREVARGIFARLVRVDGEGPPIRRLASRQDLLETGDPDRDREAATVLERFIAARLVTSDANTVRVSHEALLAAWPRLAGWVEADLEWLHLHQQLADAAGAWDRSGRDKSLLWRGARLEAAADEAQSPTPGRELNRVEAEFLHASIDQSDQERRVERRRTRRSHELLAVVAALAVAASVLAAVAIQSRGDAVTARDQALSRQVAIESQQLQTTTPSLAAQLALTAYRISPTVQARSALIDTTATETPFRLLGPAGPLFTSMSADGRLLAVAQSGDDTVALYTFHGAHRSPAPGSASTPLAVRSGQIQAGTASNQDFAVAVSPDGRMLAVGGTDRKVTLWNVTHPGQPTKVQTLTGFTNTVYSVAFSPDGKRLAAAAADGTVEEWQVAQAETAGPPRTLRAPGGAELKAVAYSPDSTRLAVAGAGGTVAVWGPDRTRPALAAQAGGATYNTVSISPDGKLLAAGASDDTVHVWHLTGAAPLQPAHSPLTNSTAHIASTAFSPDSAILAAGDSDGTLRMFDTSDWTPVASLQHPDPVTGLVFTPDGRTVVSADSGGVTDLWPLPTLPSLKEPGNVFTIAYSEEGRLIHVISSGTGGAAAIWDATNPLRPTRLGEVPLPAGFAPAAGAGAVSPDGRVLAVANNDGQIALFDVADPGRPQLLGRPLTRDKPYVEQVGFSPDGQLLAAGDDSGQLVVWNVHDPAHPRLVAARSDTAGEVLGFAFSPDSRLLADAASDNKVRVYALAGASRPRLLAALGGFTDYAYATAFTPDGRTLIAGSADGTVRLWDVTEPARPRPLGGPLSGPTGYVFQLAVSPDGRTLAAATTAHAVWLWDITNRSRPRPLATLAAAHNAVFTIKFSPDGRTLAASGSDDTLHFWAYQPDQAAQIVCASVGAAITKREWAHYVQGLDYRPPCP